MGPPRIVPWKTPADLSDLGKLFYGSFDDQKRALALCKAYQTRCPLPASVHSTALTVAAIHNDVASNDLYAIRQTYAMSLVRMVNEILDSQQTGKAAAPLHALATDLELPNAFVEVRHAATHEDLPSLAVLRDMAPRALDWLLDHFWRYNIIENGRSEFGMDRNGNGSARQPENDEFLDVSPEGIKNMFRAWRRVRRADPKAEVTPEHAKYASALQKYRLTAPRDLEHVLLKRDILIPSGPGEICRKAATAIYLWGPLFRAAGTEYENWMLDLLIDIKNTDEWPGSQPDIHKRELMEAYEQWILFLVPSASKDTVAKLASTPRPWNARFIAQYARVSGNEAAQSLAREMGSITGVKDLDFTPITNNEEASERDLKKPRIASDQPAWQKVAGWVPKPLGTI